MIKMDVRRDSAQPRIAIPAIIEDGHRPLWSVMIPTYNCARYLRETLLSVLVQDPGPDRMQIQVVDDHSTLDDPEAVVQELGRGRVGFIRQPRNVGHTRNFDTCLLQSRGHLVHLLHGDDRVRDGFYKTMARPFQMNSKIGAAFCGQEIINEQSEQIHVSAPLEMESGILENWLERIAIGQRLQTPAMVVRRRVYEQLGGFDHRIRYYGEDWEMWVRIAAAYSVWYQNEPLAAYRVHISSLSGQTQKTGENIRDLRRAIEINRAVLPEREAERITRLALEAAAEGALRRSRRMINAGEMRAPLAQMRQALGCSHSPRVILETLFGLLVWLKHSFGGVRELGSRYRRQKPVTMSLDASSQVRQ